MFATSEEIRMRAVEAAATVMQGNVINVNGADKGADAMILIADKLQRYVLGTIIPVAPPSTTAVEGH